MVVSESILSTHLPSVVSKGEATLLEILHEQFPYHKAVPQYPIKVSNRRTLYIDLVLPSLSLAFEFDGEQHDKFVKHFHKSRQQFMNARANDTLKEQWCIENGYTLIRFNSKEKITKQLLNVKIQAATSSYGREGSPDNRPQGKV